MKIKGGIVLISSEVAERLLPKFSKRAEERQQTIKTVDVGTLDQLKELVDLVARNEVGVLNIIKFVSLYHKYNSQ